MALTSASGEQSAAVATAPAPCGIVSPSLPNRCVASQIRGPSRPSEPARREPARPSEPARLEPTRQPGAARLPEGARGLRGPGTRRHRRTRPSLRAPQPTPRGGAQATGSARPYRYPKPARRGGHLRPPWRPQGRPVLPWRSARGGQPPPARGPRPPSAGTRSVPALGVDARPPLQRRARTSARGYPQRSATTHGGTPPEEAKTAACAIAASRRREPQAALGQGAERWRTTAGGRASNCGRSRSPVLGKPSVPSATPTIGRAEDGRRLRNS